MQLKLFNSLTRRVEDFKPLVEGKVDVYCCGPTVYSSIHIGNFRTYTTADILVRMLTYLGYTVQYIMNITDVGHLTGDNIGDADVGEDRLEQAARRERKTAWDISKTYTDAFLVDYEKLNLKKPEKFTKATDYIPEQIALVQKLAEKGYTYRIDDGIYFDTSKFPEYGKLSFLDLKNVRAASRIEPNLQKKNTSDFALWKFSKLGEQRQMEWDSPWGKGFPGWHIECSAMSMKYLGETFDIHIGGEDLAATHHPNEIAQSEAATGKPFVRHWMHGAFLLVDGGRMGKSLGNAYTVSDVEQRGFDPLTVRYLYLTAHYRDKLNFTWKSLEAAQHALDNLRDMVRTWDAPRIGCAEYEQQFATSLMNDLATPQALATLWDMVKSEYPTSAKHASLLKMDEVFGLRLSQVQKQPLTRDEQRLLAEREEARKRRDFSTADRIRATLEKAGLIIEDTVQGPKWRRKRR